MDTEKPIIFMTGQNGMLGQHVTRALSGQYQIFGLQRNNQTPNTPSWQYREALKQLNIRAPEIVLHLAGAGIADKRWREKYKQTIYDSRINGTQWLVDEISLQDKLPKTFMCASAIGFYGHRPDEQLTETASKGNNFVARIAEHWELASQKLNPDLTRVINLRFGMILSGSGGALKDMLLPFKFGLGGRLGNGQQKYSWISIDDATSAIIFLLRNKQLRGPINLTAPYPVSNRQFTQALASVLNRPAFMHMPAFMVRLVFGEMADELLLADAHVIPERLLEAGFEFEHDKLSTALEALL